MARAEYKPKKREWIRAILEFLFTFENKRGDVLDVWLYSTNGVNIEPHDFYSSVERRIADQKIPSMAVSRVEFAEGGLLSDQRQYLRLMRERFAIDSCAAPFGTHFFFSCRVVYVPALVRLWHIVAAASAFGLVGYILLHLLGTWFALIALVALPFAVVAVFRNAGAFTDLDGALLKIPVFSTFYENWFRVETYYRIDTRALYTTILPNMIRQAAEEACAEKGLKLVPQSGPMPELPLLAK